MAEFTSFQMRSYETAAGNEEEEKAFIDKVITALDDWPPGNITQEQRDQIVILSGFESDTTKVIALIPLQEGQALNVSWNPTVKATLKRDVTMTLHKGHIGSKS